MKWHGRGSLAALATTCMLTFAATGALAQSEWPQRQVTVVVPYAAGGTTDMFGRIFADAMQKKYGQPFIVENKAGAGGTVGSAAVAKAQPDGYTLLVGTASTHAIAPYVFKKLPYDADKDFQPISLFANVPSLLVVRSDAPVKNLADFVAFAKANDGKLSYGSSGVGGISHLPGEMMAKQLGIKMTHVPYKSSGEIMNALAGRHIDLAFDNITAALPQAKGGTVTAIAVTSGARSPSAPEIPTISETYPGFDVASWHGLFAPAATSSGVISKIAADVKEIFGNPEVQAKLKEVGAVAAPNSPSDFAAFSATERAKYKKIVAEAGIEPQ